MQSKSYLTNPNSLHHEADVSNALKVCDLVNGVDGLYMAGNLQRKGLFEQMQAFPIKRLQPTDKSVHNEVRSAAGVCGLRRIPGL